MKHRLTAVVDDYPHTQGLLTGRIRDDGVQLDFERISPVRHAFAPMVERRAFDVSEMALATYVQARSVGRPITLLPVTLLARFQHPFLLQTARRRVASPRGLEGRRVGLTSYAQTTGVWMRGILSRQFGVDLSSIEWITLEDTHVSGFERPDNVVLAPEGSSMARMLDAGEIDAAVVSYDLAGVPDIEPVFHDLESATRTWYEQTGVLQINHMVCVRSDLVTEAPQAVTALLDLFQRARDAAPDDAVAPHGDGLRWTRDLEMLPIRMTAITPTVSLIRELCIEQGLVHDDLDIDDLLDDRIRALEPVSHP